MQRYQSFVVAVLVYIFGFEQVESFCHAYYQNFAKTELACYFDDRFGYADSSPIDSDSDSYYWCMTSLHFDSRPLDFADCVLLDGYCCVTYLYKIFTMVSKALTLKTVWATYQNRIGFVPEVESLSYSQLDVAVWNMLESFVDYWSIMHLLVVV